MPQPHKHAAIAPLTHASNLLAHRCCRYPACPPNPPPAARPRTCCRRAALQQRLLAAIQPLRVGDLKPVMAREHEQALQARMKDLHMVQLPCAAQQGVVMGCTGRQGARGQVGCKVLLDGRELPYGLYIGRQGARGRWNVKCYWPAGSCYGLHGQARFKETGGVRSAASRQGVAVGFKSRRGLGRVLSGVAGHPGIVLASRRLEG